MSTIQELIFVFGVLILLYIFYIFIFDGTISVMSNIDNEYYNVRKGPDLITRVNNLSLINLKLNVIVESLSKDTKYNTFTPIQRLISKWNYGVSIKEIGRFETDAAYVLNKSSISFCLRKSPSGGELESLNILTYGAIHELAHIMSIEIGHDKEFQGNFRFLIDYSKQLTFMNPLTNKIEPVYTELSSEESAYCGVKISANAIK
jgi:hypothetical protein